MTVIPLQKGSGGGKGFFTQSIKINNFMRHKKNNDKVNYTISHTKSPQEMYDIMHGKITIKAV
jgi:hypothetical protein